MDAWFDTQIQRLEWLIMALKGHCRNCDEPCNVAANGGGHPKKCRCH